MSKIIYPNNYCPCKSGKKYKKCCQSKISIPEDRMDIKYLADMIAREDLINEQVEFFNNEKNAMKDVTVNLVCEIKKCLVRGITRFESIRKVLSINEVSSSLVDDYGLRLLIIEAGSQFIAQLNGLKEDEFIEIREALDGISEGQFEFPKESLIPTSCENN